MHFTSKLLAAAVLLSTALASVETLLSLGPKPVNFPPANRTQAIDNRLSHSPRPANHTAHVAHTNHTSHAIKVARDNDWFGGIAEDQHNWYRWYNGVDYVSYDYDLAAKAAVLANSCKYQHVMNIGGGGYGQNIAFSGSSAVTGHESPIDYLVTHTDWWYYEYNQYDNYYGLKSPPLPEGPHQFSHYTQMVWKSTTHIGCHSTFCPASKAPPGDPKEFYIQGFYTVCNYSPSGNWLGSFDSNVFPPMPARGAIQRYPYDRDDPNHFFT